MELIITPSRLLDAEEVMLVNQMKSKFNKTGDLELLQQIMKLPFIKSVGYM